MQIKNFIGPSNQARSWAVANDICRNLYLETSGGRAVLYDAPGLKSKVTINDGLPVRAMFQDNERAFIVAGGEFHEIFSDWTFLKRGDVANSSQMAMIESNRLQLMITSGGHGYIYDLRTNTLTQIPEPDGTVTQESTLPTPTESPIMHCFRTIQPMPGTRTYAAVFTWTAGNKESLPSPVNTMLLPFDPGAGYPFGGEYSFCEVWAPRSGGFPDEATGWNVYVDFTGAGTDFHRINGDTPIPINRIQVPNIAIEPQDGIGWTNQSNGPAPPGAAKEDLSVQGFPGAIMNGFLDGYFLALPAASRSLYISGLNDGSSWDSLDFGVKEGDPGDILSILVDHREIAVFGAKKTEIWYNSGDPDFPLGRRPDASIEQGIVAPWSRVRLDNSFFWLGKDENGSGIAWKMNGYSPEKVSTHAQESSWQKYSTISDAIGYVYQEDGHSFWMLSFPTADKTWAYDCATQTWTERGEWDITTSLWHRYRGQLHMFAFGTHLVGDYQNGVLYEQSLLYSDYDGKVKRWMRGCALGDNENKNVFPSNLELQLEKGAGMDEALGGAVPGNPQVMARYSKDGGRTFISQRMLGAGKIGEYTYRCRWAGYLGEARKPYIELSGTDPIRWALTELNADFEAGTS